ncbi:hypothetical protein SAY86_004374 [Trapa natans]|uniref:Uncharacterized protein n=1 Tax=Trapa natans TaxID=22666 RepID=A0AAN7RHV5_TRANT|nr:hypothetical protein SAY86_004374 [Trapa natans]
MAGTTSSVAPIARRLEDKVAIITGAANGIGEATARLFAKHGAKVVILDIEDERGLLVCKEIESIPNQTASYIHCDATNEAEVSDAVDRVVNDYGRLDIMYSNVGITGQHELRILDINYKNLKHVFETNVFSAFFAAKHASRVMIPNKRGAILFASSCNTEVHGAVPHTYCATKHAILGLTKNLATELGQHGIRVNAVAPFGVATRFLTSGYGGVTVEKAEEMVCHMANLKGVVLKAEDVAEAALYLVSDESKYVSGVNLLVDGGYSITNTTFGMYLKELYPY